MEIEPQHENNAGSAGLEPGPAIYEPLTHSETYLMSTMSDMSEDNYNYVNGINSDVSRQSSSRESRPLIRSISTEPRANLLQTISGVLHSQSVRIAPSGGNNASMTALYPIRRNLSATHATLARMNEIGNHANAVNVANANDFVRLNLDDQATATYIASTTSDLGQPGGGGGGLTGGGHVAHPHVMTHAYLGKHQQYLRANVMQMQPPVPHTAKTAIHMMQPAGSNAAHQPVCQ